MFYLICLHLDESEQLRRSLTVRNLFRFFGLLVLYRLHGVLFGWSLNHILKNTLPVGLPVLRLDGARSVRTVCVVFKCCLFFCIFIVI